MPDALLKIHRLCAGYSDHPVLHDLNLEVHRGEIVGLVGPNGHGKSTLLRCISGLIRPSSGAIHCAGVRMDVLRPDQIVARGISHVPQGDLLFPEMSVLENLLMGAYLSRSAAQCQPRLQWVFELFPKLSQRRHQSASTLSGGERRMVGIGRGLMAGSQLLMLDEPSLGLAPIVIDHIYEVLAQLKAKGMTILVVEENAMRIAEHADHMYLLDNGRFAWSGEGSELLERPQIMQTYLGV